MSSTTETRAKKAAYMRIWRRDNPEYAEQQRRWALEHRKDNSAQLRYMKRNKPMYAAHTALYRAVRDGKIARPNACSNCGASVKPEGHHPDHSKPLEVVWLCRACHKLIHRRYA